MFLALRKAVSTIGILSVLALLPAPALAQYGTGITEEELQQLTADYKKNPGALVENAHKLKAMTAEQIKLSIEALGLSHFDYIYPVDMKGKDIPEILGKPMLDYSLMAVRAGTMIPIPFQFDEYDKTGLIYIPKHSPYKIQGTHGVMDIDDSLVFMYRDGGEKRYDPKTMNAIEGEIVKEIKFTSDHGADRYVYLMKGNSERSTADYVSADLEKGVFETPVYRAEHNPKNLIEIRNVVPKAGPGYGRNIVDNVYVNISTGIFNQNLRVGLNTRDNIRAIPMAVKDGPVRANVLLKIRILYMGMPVFKDYLNVNLYEQAVNVPSRFSLDSLNAVKYFALFLKEPRGHIAVDLTGLDGSTVVFDSINDTLGDAIVDGKMSDSEHAINAARLPGDWIWFDTHEGWQVFFSNNLPVFPGGVFDAFLEGMMISILYEDDKNATTKFERYPGGEPRVGADFEGIPKVALDMLFAMRSVDFAEVESIGDMVYAIIELAERGKLDKMDKLAQTVYDKLIDEGKVKNSEDLAALYLEDLKLINFKGALAPEQKDNLNQMFYDTFASIKDVRNITALEVFGNLVKSSEKHGIDLRTIEYATQDNTVWFPVHMGPHGPTGFQTEVKNPPLFKLSDYVAP